LGFGKTTDFGARPVGRWKIKKKREIMKKRRTVKREIYISLMGGKKGFDVREKGKQRQRTLLVPVEWREGKKHALVRDKHKRKGRGKRGKLRETARAQRPLAPLYLRGI